MKWEVHLVLKVIFKALTICRYYNSPHDKEINACTHNSSSLKSSGEVNCKRIALFYKGDKDIKVCMVKVCTTSSRENELKIELRLRTQVKDEAGERKRKKM